MNVCNPAGRAPEYSLILPAYDEERLLPGSLAAAKTAMAAVDRPGELIVVDNNSRDRTAEVARQAGAIVVFEPVNQISRARNAGARAARGRFLVFVDADTFLDPGLLRDALDLLSRGRCAGGGARVGFDRRIDGVNRLLLGTWNSLSRIFHLAAGCFIFCRADAFRDVGGFSEQVYASEEIWFSRRMHAWCRRHRMSFVILPRGITTSGRKTEDTRRILLVVLTFLLFPFAPRFRSLSWFWYQRTS